MKPNSDHIENSDSKPVPNVENNEVYSDLVGQKREYDGSMIQPQETEGSADGDIEADIESENLGGYAEEGVFTDYLRPGEKSLSENESGEELHLGYQEESMFERAGFEIDPELNDDEPLSQTTDSETLEDEERK